MTTKVTIYNHLGIRVKQIEVDAHSTSTTEQYIRYRNTKTKTTWIYMVATGGLIEQQDSPE